MRSRKRGRNEHYAEPNRPGAGIGRHPDVYLVPGRVWGNVGAVILLVLPFHFVLVVSRQHRVQTGQQEGEKEFSLQKSNKEKAAAKDDQFQNNTVSE